MEHSTTPNHDPAEQEVAKELQQVQKLREVCDQYFPQFGLEKADIEALFEDAQGDFTDALGAVYGQLLENGEDPDTILAEAGILEEEA